MPAFTPGNLVIYRVGIGGATTLTANGTAVFLDEYTTSGTLVQSVVMPTADGMFGTGNQMLTANGTSTSEGLLTRSADGRYLMLAGYDAATGASLSGVARVVGRVSSSATIDTTTALTDFAATGNPRGVASTNGTDLWLSGSVGGVRYTTLGSTTSTQLSTTAANIRSAEIFDGQLYVSAQTGTIRVATVGTGLPTTSGQTISNLPGFPTSTGSPYAFFFADLTASVAGLDTLYVSDDGGSIQKYSLVSGNWASNGSITAAGVRGLTASVSGTTVSLFATSATTLFTFTDLTGYNVSVAGSTATSIATAGTNTAFRGIAFAPTSGPTITIQATSVTHAEGDSGSTAFVFTLTRSSGTADATVAFAISGTGGLDATDFVGGVLPSGTATFTGTDLTTIVTVNVAGDLTAEASETFTVTLSSPSSGYTLGSQATQTGTITDDDSHGTISVANVTLGEGDTGTTPGAFTLTRSGGSAGTVTVDYVITLPGGVGEADGSDVSATLTGTVTFLNGETSATIPFTVSGDRAVESDETFTVALSNAMGGALIGTADATATITNDDVAGTVSVSDVSIVEGDTGQSFVTVTLTRTGGSGDFTVDYATGDGTATDGDDYQAASGTAAFTGGATQVTFQVAIEGDTVSEGDEAFTVTLSNASSGANIGDGSADITITDDEGAGTVSISDAQVVEGDDGTVNLVFTLTRTAGSTAFAVTVTTADDGAVAPGDYAANSEVVAFGANETTRTFTVTVNGDTEIEGDETLFATLSGATNGAAIGDGTGVGTITSDDFAPGTVAVADVQVIEGASGTTSLVFTVTRSGGAGAFSVDFATFNGGLPDHASATAGSDYAASSGTLNFGVGQNTATITVTVNGDAAVELSEELTVTLSNATNGAAISDAVAIGTITTDDPIIVPPTGVWINEFHYDNAGADTGEFIEVAGPAGTNLAGWTLALYNGNPGQLNVYATLNLTGTIPNQSNGFGTISVPAVGIQNGGAGANGEPDGIALVNPAGQVVEFISYEGVMTAASGTAGGPAAGLTSVDVGANIFEPGTVNGTSIARVSGPPGATWQVSGSPTPGAINTGQSVSGTIAQPTVAVSDVSVNEAAQTITFTVARTNLAAGAFTVQYATANDGAIAGDDYTAASGTLSFADNQTQATVTISIADDGAPEFDDSFFFNLSSAVGATITDAQAIGTIVNDDGAPIGISIGDITVVEGDSGSSTVTFTVTRTGASGAFDVDYATSDGGATQPGDYDPASGTLSFGVGVDTQTFTVTVHGDTAVEPSEVFNVLLSGATNGALFIDASATGRILNDDFDHYIHDIQGTAYFSPILAGESISAFNVASAAFVTVRAIVTAVDNDGARQGFYIQEEITDWDGNHYTSEGIFVLTRNDANVGTAVSGVAVGDLVTVTAHVMEYQGFAANMPITALTGATWSVLSGGNTLPTLLLDASYPIPSATFTGVTPDYTDSFDDVGDSFDAANYALSYFETVEGMLVTIPDMVVADGFVSTSGGQPYFQAYSTVHADADQINSRGGYTIAGDPPIGPNTPETGTDTIAGGRHVHDGDINPDLIEVDFTGFAIDAPAGLTQNATMGDRLGDVTGIIDFDFTDRKLFVTDIDVGDVTNGVPTLETTLLGDDGRALTVATFNVENLDPTDGAARFTALANAIANNLNAPDIISIEEMQDNNGAAAGDGIDDDPNTPGMQDATGTDASTTWQMLVNALNLATGAHYQWVDQAPVYNAEGGEQSGNIRVGFLYNTDRVQLGDLAADATLAERRQYTDRIGDGVRDAGDLIQYSDNMLGGEINTADWTTTRNSLLGQFTFNGNTVFVTANHWPSKGGSGEVWQFNQNLETGQPTNSDWTQRSAVAQDVYSMLNLIQSGSPDAGIVSGGDYNDFYFYRPLTTVTGYTMADGTARIGGARFDNLTLTLPEAERYTYAFDGRSQAIDHIIVNDLLAGVATYDVVHLNTGFNTRGTGPNASPALSDHDPAVSSFDFRNFAETLSGTVNADTILGFGGNDTIFGFAGNDVIDGGTGADTMRGGGDNDIYFVDNGLDRVVEASGGGSDRIFAGASFTLEAGSEVEKLTTIDNFAITALNLTGNALSQYIYGNAGANILDGGGGGDALIGFGGDDFYYVRNAADRVIEASAGGNDRVFAAASFTLEAGSEVEKLTTADNLGTAAINLTGNALAQYIYGNAGANTLDGGGGGDAMVGLGGDDFYYVRNAADRVIEAAAGGNDRVFAAASFTLEAGSEVEKLTTVDNLGTAAINLTGNALGQFIYGNAGANILDGGGGGDVLAGLGGDDFYFIRNVADRVVEAVGGGSDRIFAAASFTLDAGSEVEKLTTADNLATTAINLTGNALSQYLYGNAGANVLDGGGGDDVLTGFGGADIFAFTTAPGVSNVDRIADFLSGTDKIALDDGIFGLALGALNANAFATGSAAQDADDRIIYNSATGALLFDADGNGAGAAIQFATLSGSPVLAASDFIVI